MSSVHGCLTVCACVARPAEVEDVPPAVPPHGPLVMAAPRLLHAEEASVRSHLRLQRRRSEENLKQPPAAELYAARIASSADELSSLNRSPSVSSSDESYSRTDFSRTDADSPSPPPPRAPSFTEQLRLLSLPGAEAPPPALAELSAFADRDERSDGEVAVEEAARRVAEAGAAPARTDSESDGLEAFDEPDTARSSDGEPPCKKRSLSREEGAAMNRLLRAVAVDNPETPVQVYDILRNRYVELFRPIDNPQIPTQADATDAPNGLAASRRRRAEFRRRRSTRKTRAAAS